MFGMGVEGERCEGGVMSGEDIEEMGERFEGGVYGWGIKVEDVGGVVGEGIFKGYGDVVEVKGEKIEDDWGVKGKWGVFGKMRGRDEVMGMKKGGEKV